MANPMMRSRVREENGDYAAEPVSVLECVIERVTFHNAENGYSVVRVTPSDVKVRVKDDLITVLGSFSNPIVGESLRCYGEWIKHPQYGSQFKLQRYETLRPASANAIEKYLGSGMVKGIGPVMAKRIVARFGEASLDVIEQQPDRLTEVSGLGGKRVEKIRAAWEEQREIRNIMLFLQGHGVTPTFAVKIYRHYKDRSIEVVERNPFQLATDIWGIGFKSADKIAQNIGFSPDDPRRLEAGIVYVLNEEVENGGHCFLPEEALVAKACEILLPPAEPEEAERRAEIAQRTQAIRDVLASLVEQERLIAETVDQMGFAETALYTPAIYATEKAVADRIGALMTFPWPSRPGAREAGAVVAGLEGFGELSEEQRDAVRRALTEPILVLTGGPGTGKTTTTRAIVAALEQTGRRLQLASPTGRAAKRAAEVTGREAKTIHRMLAFDPEKRGFRHGPDDPLDLDVLIIDEASMLDLMLTHHTLRALPNGAQVIFVGDVDQLPSVGPGNVLADLIDSGRVPVARLTQVFRQAAQSRIITNAHAINSGRMPELLPPSAIAAHAADCVFVAAEEAEDVPGKIAGIVARSLPKLGYAPRDIMVLSPMQRGTAGGRHLNEVLQAALNPPRADRAEQQRGPITFRVGDRVMQRVNNYDKNVFNGDIGTILEIDKENQTLAVDYPEGPIEYDFADLDQLLHALCATIHKSQGSEYPACVIAVHTQHYTMLQRNLLYTALTRAKRLAVFVGSKRAIAIAVRNRNVVPRFTRLRERLQNLIGDAATGRTLPTPPIPGRLL
jgi:exodeoxyribonuclease V alpha subunit